MKIQIRKASGSVSFSHMLLLCVVKSLERSSECPVLNNPAQFLAKCRSVLPLGGHPSCIWASSPPATVPSTFPNIILFFSPSWFLMMCLKQDSLIFNMFAFR